MSRFSPLAVAAAVALAPGARAEPPAAVTSPTVVYAPDFAADPQADASYPRVIRLAHAGPHNGRLLATFFHKGTDRKGELPIHVSDNGGATWSAAPIGVVRDDRHGWNLDAPALFELPKPMGDLPAGALLAAGTAWLHGDFTRQDMEVYASTDGGRSWRYRSSCVQEAGMPNREGLGIWEPFFTVAGDGSLVCYFSDERPSTQGYNQVLAHVRSTDGGRTWGREVWDVAVRDNRQRPGMTTVVRMGDGRYAMAFEDCRKDLDPDTACSVRFKTSPDGLDWSPESSTGERVDDAAGRHLLHTPYLAWSSWGGGAGTLIVSGQRLVTGAEGALTVLPQSGRVVLTNGAGGRGLWRAVAAPVVVNPTGSYGPGASGCPGYSSPILVDVSGPGFLELAGISSPNHKCLVVSGHGKLGSSGDE